MITVKTAVFPIAGMGTRLNPATTYIPKEMLPLIDKPILHYQVRQLYMAGIRDIVFVVRDYNYLIVKDYFNNYFSNLFSDKINFTYIKAEPLGLGYAISKTRVVTKGESFFVILPDEYLVDSTNILKEMMYVHNKTNSTVILTKEVNKEDIHKYGIVEKSIYSHYNCVYSIIEKPGENVTRSNEAVIGRYLFNESIYNYIDNSYNGTEIGITEAINKLIRDNKSVIPLNYSGIRFDCGSKKGYYEAIVHTVNSNPDILD